ncbi:MAG: acetyl esterase [Bacteroidia bacterium]|jgi:acetyl esterase
MLNKLKVFVLRLLYRFISARSWQKEGLDLPHSVLHMTTDQGSLALRMYAGGGGANKPLIIFLHGGGWVIGDLDTHHPFCQSLCLKTGCTIVAVDYRLAPEHPCPAAHDDALAATRWIMERMDQLGPNNGTLILAGDSAGANLATCTCLTLDPAERKLLAGEIVIYPVTDHYSNTFQDYPSYRDKAKGYSLTSSMMRWFWDIYLGNATPNGEPPPMSTPIHARNLSDLPATLLITAENDPLRDEGKAYAEQLSAAGVRVQYSHYDNEEHGFAATAGVSPAFNQLMDEVSAWVNDLA